MNEVEEIPLLPPPGIFWHEYQNKGVKWYPSLMNIKGKEIEEIDEVEEVEDVKEAEEEGPAHVRDGSDQHAPLIMREWKQHEFPGGKAGDQDGNAGRGYDSVVKEQQR